MAASIANVNSTTDTFQNWLDKTNQALDKISTVVVTTSANTIGGQTTGNAAVQGTVSANVLVATESLRGGTVAAAANLNITSNAAFSGANISSTASYINVAGAANVYFDSLSTTFTGGTLVVTSNVNFKSNTVFINTAGRLGVNTGTPDATLSVVGTANVSGNVKLSGVTTVGANITFQDKAFVSPASAPTTGYLYFGNTITRSLGYDGTQFVFATANVQVQGTLLTASITASANISTGGPGSGIYLLGDITGNSNTCSRTVAAGAYMTGGGALTGNITIAANATSNATANVIVVRDTNGSFAANVVTANVTGHATRATYLSVGGTDYAGNTASTPSTVVIRDGDRSIFANVLYGTSTTARYADLAEMYIPDQQYPAGTLIMVGGAAEVTAATVDGSVSIIGAVSTNPAYLMNSELAGGLPVALKGRVPVRVVGHVAKGQPLGPSIIPGVATVNYSSKVAIALEAHTDSAEGIIEAIIL